MKSNLILPAVLAFLASCIVASCSLDPWTTGKEYPDIVTITKTTRFGKSPDGSPMKSQAGAVKFSHKAHEKIGMKCVDCHHKNNNPDREKKCAVCHIGDNGYNTMHGLCVDCHNAKKDGPRQCRECH